MYLSRTVNNAKLSCRRGYLFLGGYLSTCGLIFSGETCATMHPRQPHSSVTDHFFCLPRQSARNLRLSSTFGSRDASAELEALIYHTIGARWQIQAENWIFIMRGPWVQDCLFLPLLPTSSFSAVLSQNDFAGHCHLYPYFLCLNYRVPSCLRQVHHAIASSLQSLTE